MSKGAPEFVGPSGGIKPPVPRIGGRAAGCVTILLVAGIITLVLYFTFLEYVGPNEYGIKEVQIPVFGQSGIQEDVYQAGYALVIPFAQIMHTLPRHTQVVELTEVDERESESLAENVFHDRPAKIQTSDGFYVDVDVSIIYRIDDAYKAFKEFGPGDGFLHKGILPKAEPILKQALGELTTEEFYNAPLRVEKAELANELLNNELNPKGIRVDHVLIRYFKYSDRIQENIEAKKLQDQLVFTNQSKQRAAEEQQKLSRIEAEGAMMVQVTEEEGKAYKTEKDAEKDLYVRSRKAEADLLLQLAEAESTRLRNEAMQQLGSDRYVAMEMAEVMKGLEFIVVPTGGADSMNPLNLDGLLKTFGVELDSAAGAPSPLNPRIKELSEAPAAEPPPPAEFGAMVDEVAGDTAPGNNETSEVAQ
ncbi:MAG: SPFH domain-containing protein [Candidatus Hydrogenedens sp.]|nr:SPFH domain-containing protein [Candidatus Hydrogenedens sp.]